MLVDRPSTKAMAHSVQPRAASTPLELVRLDAMMAVERGRPEVRVALIDGPVATDHPDLAGARLGFVGGAAQACARAGGRACEHGTYVAGILAARRGSRAPAICPGCTLLVRPIFSEASGTRVVTASPDDLARAIMECVAAGAWIVNLSVATAMPSMRAEPPLVEALDHAAARGVLVVAAAGNQGALGSSDITRHPWVTPVVAYDSCGMPLRASNLGGSIGRHGIGAPGAAIESLAPGGGTVSGEGTSGAVAFVTGALALLWSRHPRASASQLKRAVAGGPRRSVTPPLLDGAAAMRELGADVPPERTVRR